MTAETTSMACSRGRVLFLASSAEISISVLGFAEMSFFARARIFGLEVGAELS